MIFVYLAMALAFFILTKLNIEKLLAILILIFVFYYIYTNIQKTEELKQLSSKNMSTSLINNISDIKEIVTDNYYIHKTSKNIKYLLKNSTLIAVIKNVKFVKKYNKSKYSSLILHMNKLMKVYMYMLADRYDINTYLPIFNDIKADILEILYSLIFIIPEHIHNAYFVEPHKEIEKSIQEFLNETNHMISIIKNYHIVGKQGVYINNTKYKPYEKNKEMYLP